MRNDYEKQIFPSNRAFNQFTLSSMVLLTACSEHKKSSSADKTPKSSQVTHQSRVKSSNKDSGKTTSLVLKSRSSGSNTFNLQVHPSSKSLLQVQALSQTQSSSSNSSSVPSSSQSQAPKSLNENQSSASQSQAQELK